MSARATHYVWRHVRNLSPSQRLVVLKIADNCDDHGEGAPLRYDTIATDCEISRVTVKRVMRQLRDMGILHVRDPPSRGRPPTYVMPALAAVTKGDQSDTPSLPGKGGPTEVFSRSVSNSSDLLCTEGSPSEPWLVEIWNHGCVGAPQLKPITRVTPQLRGAITRALKHQRQRATWEDAMTRLRGSWFCRGGRGWTADFRWFIKGETTRSESSVSKLLQGKYDNGREDQHRRFLEQAKQMCSRTGWRCGHDPVCMDRDVHLDRTVADQWEELMRESA